MKLTNKRIKILIVLLSLIIFCSCNDDLGDREWGYAKIYMPQASILNGGLSNDYPVPFNNNPSTNNYTLDKDKNSLKVVLGVYRSGKQKLNEYSVSISTNIEDTEKIIGSITNAVILPVDTYTLPDRISVNDGEREAIFYLTVDLNKIIQKYSSITSKKLCLTVEINNPSNYELNKSLSKTNIIIDGNVFFVGL